MKRSFRVATVFTGAAAAVSLTPAVNALAMPGIPSQMPKGQEVTPNITVENCNSGTRQWIHLYYTAAENHGPTCLAHPGIHAMPPNTVIQSYCAGNNFGSIIGIDPSGSLRSFLLSPGHVKVRIDLHDVFVTQEVGESDSNTCPQ